MKRTLSFKLTVCFLGISIFLLALLNTVGTKSIRAHIVEEKKTLLYNEASLISDAYLDNFYTQSITPGTLTTQLRAVDTFINAHIMILNSQGDILIDTSDQSVDLIGKNINNYHDGLLSTRFIENTTINGLIDSPALCAVYPNAYDYKIRNYIIFYMPNSVIESESMAYTNIWTVFALLFLGILCCLFVYIYFITIHPLNRIVNAATEYAKGNFQYKLSFRGHDEYQNVSTALNYMAEELQNMDDYQKKFVANISHDFRSPLTSIKGYAEAMSDGTIPVEMQAKYLDIIVFEAERLTKLTNNLLELNSFDHTKNGLELTTFDINSVIKKTVTSFEGVCLKKKITFNLVFGAKQQFVNADLEKIQQVLYNLIDNAIKFSHPNSTIKISTGEKGEKVFTSVKDFGVGIPKASINKIWERFYKTDASRGKDKKGTGLGLSIVKEIIQAHNENIDVISTEGVGSEFTFSLRRGESEE